MSAALDPSPAKSRSNAAVAHRNGATPPAVTVTRKLSARQLTDRFAAERPDLMKDWHGGIVAYAWSDGAPFGPVRAIDDLEPLLKAGGIEFDDVALFHIDSQSDPEDLDCWDA